MNLTKELVSIAEDKIIHSYLTAQDRFKRNLEIPTIVWQDHGRTAGKAFYRRNEIHLSPTLYSENQEIFVQTTVVHEVAHLVAHSVYGQFVKPHGTHWKYVMHSLGVDASLITRCHSYDTSNVPNRRSSDKYVYLCGCCQKRFEVSLGLHRKMINGQYRWCKQCGRTRGQIKFTGNKLIG